MEPIIDIFYTLLLILSLKSSVKLISVLHFSPDQPYFSDSNVILGRWPFCFVIVSPVGDTIWKGMKPLRDEALMEKVHHWEQALRFASPVPTSCPIFILPVWIKW